jgi:uncharacterized membrane protein
MKKDYDSIIGGTALVLAGVMIGLALGIQRYPEPLRFTEKIENVNAVKVLAVDGEVYWVVQEKIGKRTYNIILKPVGKILEKEGEI